MCMQVGSDIWLKLAGHDYILYVFIPQVCPLMLLFPGHVKFGAKSLNNLQKRQVYSRAW